MINRSAIAFLLALFPFAVSPAQSQDLGPKPDDTVSFELTAEDWVATKTAHVVLAVDAAVSAETAGTMRPAMAKAVNDAAKGEWRLTGFNRMQDQTGLERWTVLFDTRLPETALNGLGDAVKKASKAGMQIRIAGIDFSPSQEETEAVHSLLRERLYKQTGQQLATLNAALPGRNYRISQIVFDSDLPSPPMAPMMARGKAMVAADSVSYNAAPERTQEVSQKLVLKAHIVFAADPPRVK